MQPDSFEFGRVDMLENFGIRMIKYDPLMPPLRPRKIEIPDRSGSFDYGGRYYNERPIPVECDTTIGLTRQQVREIAYVLGKKNTLRFWDEPEKYYIGRVYDAANIIPVGSIGQEFRITFVCEPFAYGRTVTEQFSAAIAPQYQGSAETPTRIEIKNTGDTPINGVCIIMIRRKEAY